MDAASRTNPKELTDDVNHALDSSSKYKTFLKRWGFSVKRIVLFIISVLVVIQFTVYTTKRTDFLSKVVFGAVSNTNNVSVGTIAKEHLLYSVKSVTAGAQRESVLRPLIQQYNTVPGSLLWAEESLNIDHLKQERYKILIFGEKDRLAQRLEFLTEVNGIWQHSISCGNGIQIDVRVGVTSSDLDDQNAVVFNMDEIAVPANIAKLVSMPSSSRQAWIYYGREPAVRMRWLFKNCGALPLHGVWSYQDESEVLMKYGYFVPERPMTNETRSASQWSREKTKLVAWMVQNCYNTFWPRSKYVSSLLKHIPVDIYGKCSGLVCNPMYNCREILSQYKFYLALESAECEDYITEKVWETAYMNGIVPVVYGALKSCYLKEAPPNSFIYAGDFKSTKDLANFLNMLDKRPDLYAKYFEWRYKGHIELSKKAREPFPSSLFCSLVPFIAKVERGEVKKRSFSELPYYSSCKIMKGKNAMFRPLTHSRAKRWKLDW